MPVYFLQACPLLDFHNRRACCMQSVPPPYDASILRQFAYNPSELPPLQSSAQRPVSSRPQQQSDMQPRQQMSSSAAMDSFNGLQRASYGQMPPPPTPQQLRATHVSQSPRRQGHTVQSQGTPVLMACQRISLTICARNVPPSSNLSKNASAESSLRSALVSRLFYRTYV